MSLADDVQHLLDTYEMAPKARVLLEQVVAEENGVPAWTMPLNSFLDRMDT